MKKRASSIAIVFVLSLSLSPQLAYAGSATKIHHWFKAGNLTMRLNSWKCDIKRVGNPNNGGTYTAQKSFCLANLTVRNSSKVPAEFDNSGTVTDLKGRKFNEDDTAAVYANETIDNFYNPTLNPTFSLTGNIVFDVPKGDSFRNLQIQEVAFPSLNLVDSNVSI